MRKLEGKLKMAQYNFPARYLLGLSHLIDKNDLREYLRGVWLSSSRMYAANHWGLGRIDCASLRAIDDTFIPINTVDKISKEFKKRYTKIVGLSVLIEVTQSNGLTVLSLQDTHWTLDLNPAKRPDFDRTIPGRVPSVWAQFDWDKVALFNRVAEAIENKKHGEGRASLHPTGGYSAARVVIRNLPEFTGLIMPLKT